MFTPIRSHGGRSPARAVIFDLDGTLTKPYFDFDAIRREVGLPIGSKVPILESLAFMTPDQRTRAEEILHRHEYAAAVSSELQDGAIEVLSMLRARSIPIGLLTRNSRSSVELVLTRHDINIFDYVYTREDGPPKPSPEPILAMCRRWSVEPISAWVVGDYLFDLQAGRAAGATTVLMIGDDPHPEFADQAHHVIRRLRDLLPLMAME